MAEKLAGFNFQKPQNAGSRYPWEEWFDGSVWKLVQEEDFPGRGIESFAAAIYSQAKRRNCKARVAQRKGYLVMQAYPNGALPAGK